MIFFISGNDTNIGKTFVSSLLVNSLSRKYSRIAYIKPIESGISKPSLSDLAQVKKFNKSLKNVDFFQFETFIEPVAPITASVIEKVNINCKEIIKQIKKIDNEYDLVLVEGAGGLRVPITKDIEIIDLIKSLKAKVILVVTPFLGTLNHTLMSVDTLKHRKIDLEGIIINFYPKNPNISELHNPILINEKKIKILGVVPRMTEISLKSGKVSAKSFFSSRLGGQFSSINFLRECKYKFKLIIKKYAN